MATFDFNEYLKKKKEQENIAPVNGEEKATLFKKSGAFDDGYQKGDITLATLASLGDLGINALKGGGRLVEGVTDLAGYGAAGVVRALGNDELADQLKYSTMEYLTDKLAKPAEDVVEPYSVLGERGDEVAEGIGQVSTLILTGNALGAAGVGAQAASAATMGFLGTSSVGSGMTEAYMSNATDQQALTYGLVKGAIEVGSEAIFGGLGRSLKAIGFSHGLTQLDDMLAKGLSSRISNRVMKNLVQFGVKASAEGLEEVIAAHASAVAKWMIYLPKADLKALVKDENALEQFIVGALTSGVMQSGIVPGTKKGSLASTIKNNQDFITGLTPTEQDVVNKAYEQEVAKAEQDGEKATAKQKNTIYERLLESLEKGGIDTKLIDSVVDENPDAKVEGTRLEESYREQYRAHERYDADLNQYNAAERVTIQKAIESGILNNTRKTHDFVDIAAKIAAEKGIHIEFTNNQKLKEQEHVKNGRTINAYTEGNQLVLNVDSTKSLASLVGHELTHTLKNSAYWNQLVEAVRDYGHYNSNIYHDMQANIRDNYKSEEVGEEIIADVVGEYLFEDEAFVQNLSTKNQNLFQRIFAEIKHLLNLATAGSKQARDLERVKRAFEKAYRNTDIASKNVSTDDIAPVKYSLSQKVTAKQQKAKEEVFNEYYTEKLIVEEKKAGHELSERKRQKLREELIAKFENGEISKSEVRKVILDKNASEKQKALTNQYIDDAFYAFKEDRRQPIRNSSALVFSKQNQAAQKQAQIQEQKKVQEQKKAAQKQETKKTTKPNKTLEKALKDPRFQDTNNFAADVTRADIENAIKTGKITVYSPKPIKNGVFVSPNQFEASIKSNNADQKTYKTTVRVKDVDWKNPLQGTYNATKAVEAPIKQTTKSTTKSTTKQANKGTQKTSTKVIQEAPTKKAPKISEVKTPKPKTQEVAKPVVKETQKQIAPVVTETAQQVTHDLSYHKAKVNEIYQKLFKSQKGYNNFVKNPDTLNDIYAKAVDQYLQSADTETFDAQTQKYFQKVTNEYKKNVTQRNAPNFDATSKMKSAFAELTAAQKNALEAVYRSRVYAENYNNAGKSVLSMRQQEDIFFDALYDLRNGRVDQKALAKVIGKTTASKAIDDFGKTMANEHFDYMQMNKSQQRSVERQNQKELQRRQSREVERAYQQYERAQQAKAEEAQSKAMQKAEKQLAKNNDAAKKLLEKYYKMSEKIFSETENAADAWKRINEEGADILAKVEQLTVVEMVGDKIIAPTKSGKQGAIKYSLSKESVSQNKKSSEHSIKPGKTSNVKTDPLVTALYEQKIAAEARNNVNITDKEKELILQQAQEEYNIAENIEIEEIYNRKQVLELTDADLANIRKKLEQRIKKTGSALTDAAKEILKTAKSYYRQHPDDIAPIKVKPKRTTAKSALQDIRDFTNILDFINESDLSYRDKKAFTKMFEDLREEMRNKYVDIREKQLAKKAKKDTHEDVAKYSLSKKDESDTSQSAYTIKKNEITDAPTKLAQNIVGDETPLKEKPTAKEKLKNTINSLRTNLVDKYSVFEDLALETGNRELDAKANYMRYSEQRAQHFIGHGADGVKALMDVRQEVKDSGLNTEFQRYIYDMLNTDRMTLETRAKSMLRDLRKQLDGMSVEDIKDLATKNITQSTTKKRANEIRLAREYVNVLELKNKPVRSEQYTAEISQENAQKMEAEHPEFKQWAEDIYKINDYLRQKLVDDGEISQQVADFWAKLYPHYVPIRRRTDGGTAYDELADPLIAGVGVYDEDANHTGVNAPIKRATGGNANIDDLFRTLAIRAEQTYKAGAKNQFGIELKNTLQSPVSVYDTTFDEMIDSVDTLEDRIKKAENGNPATFTIYENGEKVEFSISDDMYEALKPTNEFFAKTYQIPNALSKWQKSVLTEYNPFFTVRNAVKDLQDVFLNSQHAIATYANVPAAVGELWAYEKGYETTYAKEYFENGGEQNTYFDSKDQVFQKDDSTFKKILGFIPRTFSVASNFVERVPRLAEYIASREAGASIEMAMLDSARVTTNFAAGGDVTKWANRNGFTFLNASVQGAAQHVRNIREAKMQGLKGMGILAAKFVAAGLPFVILNSLLWDDDEDYEELSDYIKENYYVLAKYGDGEFVRIPKGRAMAVIQNAFEQMKNLATGDDEVDLKRFGQLIVDNLAPNNPFDNNVWAPIVQAMTNKTWYKEDLVPQNLQDLPAAEQYDENTDAISKWLGEATNLSPYKLNYLLDQYTGVIGDMFLPMLTPKAESGNESALANVIAPLLDQFTTDSVLKNQNVSDFYETKDKVTTNAKSRNATDIDKLQYKYLNSISTDMNELYKQKREIENSDLSDAEKYAAVRNVQKQINELAERGLNDYTYVEQYGNFAIVGGKYYKCNVDGSWESISDEQLARQIQTMKQMGIDANTYWSGKHGIAKAVGGVDNYTTYNDALSNIVADKDANGNSISGSRKQKVTAYINTLDISYGEKLILFKSQYPSDNRYNSAILEYLDNREDISYEDMIAILVELGFTVNGSRVTW